MTICGAIVHDLAVTFNNRTLPVWPTDGRTIRVPLRPFLRLQAARLPRREPRGLHWDELDECRYAEQ